ncbi:MAG TPA: ABC transporter ATP-binding protein [Candidatus Saccharimonadales bacterium]|nr:ABC transporter ATP-binding protein [Candidatus Saccharimonadales bacterium]
MEPVVPPAIRVSSVSKDFILPHARAGSVKQAFTGLFRNADLKNETQHVLHNVSFDVQPGEFIGILGRNGSGKSTLLKLLAGIYQPTRGSVQIRGQLVPFIELGVGFKPELTGRENVYLNGALMGFSTKEVAAMYNDIVAFAELERFMDQKLKNYSSGMQVRLAFSVAIIASADILLVDEVLAVGDADFKRKCYDYFKSLKKQKKTVILVTHEMSAVREYCDRAILINKGKIVQDGAADEVAEAYTRLFIDEEVPSGSESNIHKRWGDGSASITKVDVSAAKLTEKDKQLEITVTFKANKELDNPVAGFLVKDAADHELFGTNSTIKRQKLGLMRPGDTRTIVWTIPNIMADGKHFVNATVEHADGVTVCDWWAEAASFVVRKSEATAYAITPPVTLTVQKTKGKA